MSKVEISNQAGRWRLVVDGVDLAAAVIDGGVRVEILPWPELPRVHVTFRADWLNMRLSDAVIKAVRDLAPDEVVEA